MDDKARETLQEELAELEKAENQIREAMKPFYTAMTAIEVVRTNLLEKHDAEVAGTCEHCDKLLPPNVT